MFNSTKNNHWWVILILCISTILYIPSFDNDLTNWDDNFNVTQNPDITSLDIHTIQKVFSRTYVGMYMPFTMLTYAFDYFFSPEKSIIFHLTNLFIHLMNILLLWFLLKKLNTPMIYNFMACLVFAVHPLNSEAVYWVSSRGQLLFSMFTLLSVNCYIKYRSENKYLWYVLALVAFVLGLLSKSLTIILPLVLLLFEHFIQKQKTKFYIFKLLPFLILAIIIAFVTYFVREGMHEEDTIISLTQWYHRPWLILYSWMFYIEKFFMPLSLSAYHPYIPGINQGMFIFYYIYGGIAIILIIIFILLRKKFSMGFAYILLFIIFILPVCNIIPFGRSVVAERYAYPAIIGLELFIIFLVTMINKEIFKKLMLYLSLIWILFLGYQTYKRDACWQNSINLWKDITDKNEKDYFSFYMYGNSLIEINDFYKAILQYNKALEIKPNDYKVLNNRGNVYAIIENYDAALKDYTEVIKLHPNDMTFFNRGKIYLNLQKNNEACKDFQSAYKYGHPDAILFLKKYCKL